MVGSEIRVDFMANLDAIRISKGYSVKGFCKKCKIERTLYYKWRYAICFPSTDHIAAMCTVLNCDPDVLFRRVKYG